MRESVASPEGSPTSITVHGSCVAIDGRGLLIIGPSGSGKSSLSLRLLSLGAQLVADDRTVLKRTDGHLAATAPGAIAGVIEARGVGLLVHPAQSGVVLAAVVDMGTEEKARLPERHIRTYLGVTLPCLHNADSPHFAAALLLYMKGGMKRFDD
ncbi:MULTISPECIES: HPr kinase/phosphorylase [unclassified Sulfitobacter]|uniref:HPr kinase/phosphorylase n=1 Tax=unclassified Sulfitobacter TaxID=196795 RepID=UPI0007C3F4CC|nr:MULTISPECIES: hypothetical protein [unclassified Sulfitobacter]KZY03196.1 hypothetical protein A3721_03795 [Sulfitobacter sp. HI0023]KZY24499.1 hypothetical protein A3728_05280 [Sulfitobacter sp. HI0040]KZZ69346.1 hypothetical protein A3764_11180 [Sulfitobacter sp. HI0129]